MVTGEHLAVPLVVMAVRVAVKEIVIMAVMDVLAIVK